MLNKVKTKKNQLMAKTQCYMTKGLDMCEKNDLKLSTFAMTLFAMANSVSVMAGATSSLIGTALGYVCYAFQMVGVFICIFQFIQLVSAIREENGDRQQKAIVGLVVGAAFLGAGVIANQVLKAAGITNITVKSVTL